MSAQADCLQDYFADAAGSGSPSFRVSVFSLFLVSNDIETLLAGLLAGVGWATFGPVFIAWLLDLAPPVPHVREDGRPARPYLTVILDEYSRMIVGYRLSFERPSAYTTGLVLRQAIKGKNDSAWPVCGIPDHFYTDHGSDFTSHYLRDVAADLRMQLVFSQPGRARGRGKVERFFRTVKQLFLPGLAGVIPRESTLSIDTTGWVCPPRRPDLL